MASLMITVVCASKEFRKLVSVWQRYAQEYCGMVF